MLSLLPSAFKRINLCPTYKELKTGFSPIVMFTYDLVTVYMPILDHVLIYHILLGQKVNDREEWDLVLLGAMSSNTSCETLPLSRFAACLPDFQGTELSAPYLWYVIIFCAFSLILDATTL